VAVVVEGSGGLAIGARRQEPVEGSKCPGLCLTGLPGPRRDGDLKRAQPATSKTHSEGDDRGRPVDGDVFDYQPGHTLTLALRGGRVVPKGWEIGRQCPDPCLLSLAQARRGLSGPVCFVLGLT
jgi:hypothetical protein